MRKRQSTAQSKRPNRKHTRDYSIYKKSEGGLGIRDALSLLRCYDIECAPTSTPYMGHDGVRVYGGKRVQRKAEKLLFG